MKDRQPPTPYMKLAAAPKLSHKNERIKKDKVKKAKSKKLNWRLGVLNEIENGVLNALHIESPIRSRKLIN